MSRHDLFSNDVETAAALARQEADFDEWLEDAPEAADLSGIFDDFETFDAADRWLNDDGLAIRAAIPRGFSGDPATDLPF